MKLNISIGDGLLGEKAEAFIVKIASESYEINIWIPKKDIHKIEEIQHTLWENGSLQLGKCANSDVFWSCDGEDVSILVGDDNQTWDFGIDITLIELNNIINLIKTKV